MRFRSQFWQPWRSRFRRNQPSPNTAEVVVVVVTRAAEDTSAEEAAAI